MFKLNKNTRDDVNEAGLVIFLLTLNKYMLAYAYHKKKNIPDLVITMQITGYIESLLVIPLKNIITLVFTIYYLFNPSSTRTGFAFTIKLKKTLFVTQMAQILIFISVLLSILQLGSC